MQTDTIHLIPTEQIDVAALTRDRVFADDQSMQELRNSILANGLRMPIEVFEIDQQSGTPKYALISGFRRVAVFRYIAEILQSKSFSAIPAIIRHPDTIAAACMAMVEENAIRADISPYEFGRIVLVSVEKSIFSSVDEAVDSLYKNLSPQKRSRIRAMASVVEAFDDVLTAPEALSFNQGVRISTALRAGFGDIIHDALRLQDNKGAASDWASILPYLIEAEHEISDSAFAGSERRSGRPRRSLRLLNGIVIRREATRSGYSLHFTGRTATSDLIDAIMSEIDRMFAPAETQTGKLHRESLARAEQRQRNGAA